MSFLLLLIFSVQTFYVQSQTQVNGGVLLPRPSLNCSKYTVEATYTTGGYPSASGRVGWNGIYTDSKGISRRYSWKTTTEKDNVFYFNCSAKYPVHFGIMTGLEKCNMSKSLEKNLEYRVKLEKGANGASPAIYSYSYSTWAPIYRRPISFIVGVYCQGVCNSLKRETYYSLNWKDGNAGSNKLSSLMLHLDLPEPVNSQDLCMDSNGNEMKDEKSLLVISWRRFLGIWVDYPKILVGIGILSIPIGAMLVATLISCWWYSLSANCPWRKGPNNRVRAASREWYDMEEHAV